MIKGWTIGRKLYGGFGVVIILSIVFSVFVIREMMEFREDIKNYQSIQEREKIGKDLQLKVANIWQFMTDASLTKDKNVVEEEARPNFEGAFKDIDRLIELNKDEPENVKKLGEIKGDLKSMWDVGNRMVDAYMTDWSKGNIVMEEYDKAADNAIKSAEAVVKGEEEEGRKAVQEIQQMTVNGIRVTVAITVLVILLSITVAFFVTRGITKPIAEVVDELKDIAEGEGDLTRRLNIRRGDEVGELARWFDTFVEKVHDIIVQISHTTRSIASDSEQLSASATQIAKGTQSQTERAMAVAASAEEMSATVIEVAKNTTGASESAKGSDKLAQKGKAIVERTVGGMNDISKSIEESASVITQLGTRSSEIGEIIKVIDDIADQTNLLALNAAIEAARAGEHGRGFAVVADEVRKLAEKTTKATKEIGDMITAIQDETGKAVTSMGVVTKEVGEEVKLAKDAGDSLNEIVSNVDRLNTMIQQIAVASEEQSAATDTISRDIQDIANTTKETAVSATQVAKAADELSRMSEELSRIVNRFKIDKSKT